MTRTTGIREADSAAGTLGITVGKATFGCHQIRASYPTPLPSSHVIYIPPIPASPPKPTPPNGKTLQGPEQCLTPSLEPPPHSFAQAEPEGHRILNK